MRDLWISLNEKYQRNKSIIWFIIAVVVLFILVTRNMDKLASKTGGSSNKTAASESVYNEPSVTNTIKNVANNTQDNYNSVVNELKDVNINGRNSINLFIELCNNKKFKSAYEMLSEECKSILYPTEEQFIKKYGNTIFKTKKNYNIEAYRGGTYKVSYKEDALTTGGSTSSVSPEYITLVNDGKLNIGGLIGKEDTSLKANNAYLSAEITSKTTYVDHEEYQVKIKNIVKADLYINQNLDNGLYIEASNGNITYVSAEEYIEQEYLIPSETTKVVSLKFNKKYEDGVTKYLKFDNVKVVNKDYYNYEEKKLQKTNYPERVSFIINI